MNEPYLKNMNAEPIHVNHADLTRCSYGSVYKSKCPVCENGILLVHREGETLELSDTDRCLLCGQLVIYDDIKAMREWEK